MKTFLLFIGLLLCASAGLGQEAGVPAGECRIFLNNGKKIDKVQLRKIDTLKVEYIKGGNLNDIRVMEISSIEANEKVLYFDKYQRLCFRNYDQLIMKNGDTITGVILDITDNNISIRMKSTSKIKRYWPSEVVEYNIGTNDKSSILSSVLLPEASVTLQEPTKMVRENNENKAVSASTMSDTISGIPAEIDSGMKNNYYLDSYQRGTDDADSIRTGGWGAGGFFLGLCYGSAYLTLGAINSKVEDLEVPQGVDAALYKEGFKTQLIHKRSKSAAAGAAVAKAIVTVVLLIAISSGM